MILQKNELQMWLEYQLHMKYGAHQKWKVLRKTTQNCDRLVNRLLNPTIKPLDHIAHIQRWSKMESEAITALKKLISLWRTNGTIEQRGI